MGNIATVFCIFCVGGIGVVLLENFEGLLFFLFRKKLACTLLHTHTENCFLFFLAVFVVKRIITLVRKCIFDSQMGC